MFSVDHSGQVVLGVEELGVWPGAALPWGRWEGAASVWPFCSSWHCLGLYILIRVQEEPSDGFPVKLALLGLCCQGCVCIHQPQDTNGSRVPCSWDGRVLLAAQQLKAVYLEEARLNIVVVDSFIFIYLLIYPCKGGDWTQNIVHSWQALYYWVLSPACFFFP